MRLPCIHRWRPGGYDRRDRFYCRQCWARYWKHHRKAEQRG